MAFAFTQPEATSVDGVLRWRASHRPDALAFRFLRDDADQSPAFTFAELDQRARGIAGLLQDRLRPGEAALLVYPPGIDYIAALFGCLYAGVPAVPAYPPRSTHHLARLEAVVADASTAIALTDRATLEMVEKVIDKRDVLRALRWVTTDTEVLDPAAWRARPIGPDDLALLQYTSGSTAKPKGVMVTHGSLLANVALIAEAMELVPEDVPLFWLPPYHDMGLVGAILTPLYAGLGSHLMSPASFLQKPARWLRAISRWKATISGSPNFAYELCAQRVTAAQEEDLDLSSLRLAFSGAETIHARTLDGFAARFSRVGFDPRAFLPCYGLAEATLFVSGARRGAGARRLLVDAGALERDRVEPASGPEGKPLISCGRPGSTVRIAVVHPATGRRSAPGETGEIWVAGPSLAKGYWRREEETRATFGASIGGDGPYLRTGDLGFLHDGELFITGRSKEVMIIRGRNYYPHDVEPVAQAAHPSLRGGAAAAFAVEIEEEEGAVVVCELDRAYKGDPAPVVEAIRQRLAEVFDWQLHAVVLVRTGGVPRTTSGKIQRRACRDLFLRGELPALHIWTARREVRPAAQPEPEPPPSGPPGRLDAEVQDALRAGICARLAALLKRRPDDIDPAAPLSLVGLDSVNTMTFSGELEDWLECPISPTMLYDLQNINAIARHLAGRPEVVERLSREASRSRPISLFAAPSRYEGGESFQLLEVMRDARRLKFLERVDYCSRIFSVMTDGPTSLYKRQILSTTDREVEVLDPTTGEPRKMLMFGSNNYLGLAGHPHVLERVRGILGAAGAGLGGAPLLSGYTRWHRELEERLSALKGTEDTLLYSTGYSANVGLVAAACIGKAIVLCDEYSHASFRDGLTMAQVRYHPFRHNDVGDLEGLLERYRHEAQDLFVGVEGLYSMDGDLAPLDQMVPLCERYGAILLLDDAHATGVVGATGRGAAEHFGVKGRIPATMGTLSKALAGLGGFISASKPIVDYLRFISRSYMFSTSMPPVLVATALAGLEVIEREPARLLSLQQKIRAAVDGLRGIGLPIDADHASPILAVRTPVGMDIRRAALLFHRLGVFVNSIEYPAVPLNQQRFRVSVMATHTESDIQRLVEAFGEVWHRLGRPDEAQPEAPGASAAATPPGA
jgi:8-amino-7-oxononanoate synthase